MFFHKILNIVLFCTIFSVSSISIASGSDSFYKDSINLDNGDKITLMSRGGHENDVLFPKEENNNNQDEKKEIRIEFDKDDNYKVIYNNIINISANDINLLSTFLYPYIKVSSVKGIKEKEMHFPFEEFIPFWISIEKIVFDNICSKCNDFDLVITNNRDDALGIIFNLSDDSKFGNIYLNNIDSLTVKTNPNNNNNKNYEFSYKNISAMPDSKLTILAYNRKSVSRIEK